MSNDEQHRMQAERFIERIMLAMHQHTAMLQLRREERIFWFIAGFICAACVLIGASFGLSWLTRESDLPITPLVQEEEELYGGGESEVQKNHFLPHTLDIGKLCTINTNCWEA